MKIKLLALCCRGVQTKRGFDRISVESPHIVEFLRTYETRFTQAKIIKVEGLLRLDCNIDFTLAQITPLTFPGLNPGNELPEKSNGFKAMILAVSYLLRSPTTDVGLLNLLENCRSCAKSLY